ncbi:hypothetical protein [Actinomyces qiguomingii]|uniref:hypothetical protein n=1 Tax=Actinomyces qiguomingii TaxID=2057800 RepID=UPI000FFF0DE4|nr:hypothetical protein [Actinomyces qiguomingii]
MALYRRPARLTAELVQAGHERALNELLVEFNRQMDVTWQLLDLDRLDQTRADWLRHAVEVVSSHQEKAADIAAEFCQDWSRLFTGQGMTILRPGLQADVVIREIETALDALGPAGVKQRIRDGISPEAAMRGRFQGGQGRRRTSGTGRGPADGHAICRSRPTGHGLAAHQPRRLQVLQHAGRPWRGLRRRLGPLRRPRPLQVHRRPRLRRSGG